MSSTLDRIGEEIAADVTHLDAALHRILTKLRVFDAGGGYVSQGFRTCAQWLSWRVSWTLNTAREHVRVANALGGLPLIDHALECGKLSYSKARALTRVASPANEAVLLEMALYMTGHHLEQLCRKFASVKHHDDPNGTSRPTTPGDDIDRRYVHRRDREDGMVVFEAVLHPDEADIVSAALDRIAKERCRARAASDTATTTGTIQPRNVSAETSGAPRAAAPYMAAESIANPLSVVTPTTVAARPVEKVSAETSDFVHAPRVRPPTPSFDRATALVEMAQQVLRGSSPERAPTDIMISIPLDVLRHGNSSSLGPHAEDSTLVACCRGGGALSAVAARRLACDAGVIAVIEDANGDALSVGRKTRTIPASMKRAMLRRDHKCRYPGFM